MINNRIQIEMRLRSKFKYNYNHKLQIYYSNLMFGWRDMETKQKS